MIWLPYLLAGGVLTFLTRLSFILLLGRIETPNWLTRALRFVPPAVLSAIVFQEVLIRDGALALSLDNLRLPAALLAGFIAWRTGNTLLTIAAGMVALWVLQGL
jgi:branched-subunit amino acid transport protein